MKKVAILSSHNGSGFETLYKATKLNQLNISFPILISNNTNAPVLQKAQEYRVQTHLINSKTCSDVDETIYKLLLQSECDYVFLSGYMKKISSKITNNFKIINSHPSLLPKYGGPGMYGTRVHEAVIANGEKKSGVTIHEVNENYDEGKILLQKELLLEAGETVYSLEQKIKALEKIAIVEAFKHV